MDELNPELAPEVPIPPVVAAAPESPLYVPAQDERTYATLAHALQMPCWWIGPLIILITKSHSRFIKFHALQAFLLQAIHALIVLTSVVVWIAVIFGSIANTAMKGSTVPAQPPVALIAFMPLLWLLMFGMYVVILVFTIVYSIKAGKGEWAGYPVLGRLARYFLNF